MRPLLLMMTTTIVFWNSQARQGRKCEFYSSQQEYQYNDVQLLFRNFFSNNILFHCRARMGNIRGWGGPLSRAWHNRTIKLQHLILDRMRDLGIIPVLPAFAGHVPRDFIRVFPEANVTKVKQWNDFEDEYCWYKFYHYYRYFYFCFQSILVL